MAAIENIEVTGRRMRLQMYCGLNPSWLWPVAARMQARYSFASADVGSSAHARRRVLTAFLFVSYV
jgi:hypothetical protein